MTDGIRYPIISIDTNLPEYKFAFSGDPPFSLIEVVNNLVSQLFDTQKALLLFFERVEIRFKREGHDSIRVTLTLFFSETYRRCGFTEEIYESNKIRLDSTDATRLDAIQMLVKNVRNRSNDHALAQRVSEAVDHANEVRKMFKIKK